MWFILWLVYGALLVFFSWCISSRNGEPDPEFFAAAPLAFNHLIVEKDLQDISSSAPSTAAAPAPSTGASEAPVPDEKKTPAQPAQKAQPAAPPPLDAKKAKFVGKYTAGSVGQRQLLRQRELSPMPSLSPPDAVLRVLLPVSADDVASGKINAGSGLCIGRPTPAKVVAVICAAGISAPCNAIVDVTPADAANLSLAGGKKSPTPSSADDKCG